MKLTCPTENRLREFLEGAVSNTEADQISDHVDSCSSCDLVISKLESNQDHVLEELREGLRIESVLNEPELHQLRKTVELSFADTTAAPDAEEHVARGKRLRDYRLVKKIGEGGMGTVYQAVHVHLAKHVALKILPADKLRSGQSVSRFRQEMRAVGRVNHPNVVSASDAGTVDGQHFLVMELVQGADLARIIHDRGPLSVADACEIVRQAAIGLQHAHDNELVHRDVKPSNIMLAIDGGVKLLDLGLAGLNNTEFESTANVVITDRLTSVGQIMGTLDYMAPEQITASPQVDGKADIYALGATLFQLLTGRTPCGDRSEGTPERIQAVLHNPPLDIATLRNDVPEELCELLLRMLAKNPDDRPQAAIDVASELERFTSDADLVALAEVCRTSLDMPSADVDVTDDVSFVVSRTAQSQDEVNSRRPLTAIALASFFLALLAAVVYYIQTNNGVVRVEVTDPTLKVAISDQTITMNEGNKKPLTIRAGEQSLVVRQDDSGLEFETDRFQIRRGDKIAFKAELLDGEVVVSKDGENFHRKAITPRKDAEAPMPSLVESLEAIPKMTANGLRYEGTVTPQSVLRALNEDLFAYPIDEKFPETEQPWSWGGPINLRTSVRGDAGQETLYSPVTELLESVATSENAAGQDEIRLIKERLQELEHERGHYRIEALVASAAFAYQRGDFNNASYRLWLLRSVIDDQPPQPFDISLWLVAQKGLGFDSTKVTAEQLADRAVAAADKYDNQLAKKAILRERAKLFRESGAKQAEDAVVRGDLEKAREILRTVPGVGSWEYRGGGEVITRESEAAVAYKLAELLEKAGKHDDAADAYLDAYRGDVRLCSESHFPVFKSTKRLAELADFFTESRLKEFESNTVYSTRLLDTLVSDESTRAKGYELLQRVWVSQRQLQLGLVIYKSADFWKDVPDPLYYLRSLMLPEKSPGWDSIDAQGVYQLSGSLDYVRPLLQDKAVLRQFADEVQSAIEESPDLDAGVAVLSYLEAELGNNDRSANLAEQVLENARTRAIPWNSAAILGKALEGKSAVFDRLAIRLFEASVASYPDNKLLRKSPLLDLSVLLAKYDRRSDARQLLLRLEDGENLYNPCAFSLDKKGKLVSSCTQCHRQKRSVNDYNLMSERLTDIGYPVDALLSLARIDASFGNAFSGSAEWSRTTALPDFEPRFYRDEKEEFQRIKTKAEAALTPQAVLDALENGVFAGRRADADDTHDPESVIDLMLAVRGEQARPQAKLFSPVVEILELAADSGSPLAHKDIDQLDKRIVSFREQHAESLEASIVSTVFAFLRNDFEAARQRLKQLQTLRASSAETSQRSDLGLWLVARYALANNKTQPDGEQLAKWAIKAAEQFEPLWTQAILREQKTIEVSRSDSLANDGQDSLDLASRLAQSEDWDAACDAYLSAYRSDPNLFNSSSSSAYKHVQVFKKAGRLTELANFFDQTRVHRMGHHNGLDRLVRACRTKQETQAAGYELLKRIFNNPPYSDDWTTTSNLILRSIRWNSVPDPVFYLRCVLLPTDFEQPGWQRLSVTSASYNQYGVDGYLTLARPLYHDREALRQFATEIRELIEQHPKWVGGWALWAFIEAEGGNTRAAVDVLRKRFLDADSDEIPPSAAWLLGECLKGKGEELDRVVIELLEPVVRKIATLTYKRPAGTHGPTGPKSLRLSPIKTLAGLYAKYGRELEARQLLYGLVDSTNQHPLVEGYAGNTMGTTLSCTGQRCLACHQVERGESNFPSYYDFTELSDAMTDIGYPVDSLIALARMDKSYGNAFDSAKGWLDDRPQWAGYLMFKIEHGYFEEQQSKAERRVTPGTVLEALELDTFQRSSRVDGKVVLDLMLSVRGEGPDAKATVFSPVVDILKLAAESKGTDAAKDIAELDKRLVTLSDQHPKSVEAGIAATVFAFLRNDLESAKDRLKRLQAITDYPKSDGATFWLAARHALQHDQTRIIGAVLAERALTAAETQPDSGLKEAILHEQSGIRTK